MQKARKEGSACVDDCVDTITTTLDSFDLARNDIDFNALFSGFVSHDFCREIETKVKSTMKTLKTLFRTMNKREICFITADDIHVLALAENIATDKKEKNTLQFIREIADIISAYQIEIYNDTIIMKTHDCIPQIFENLYDANINNMHYSEIFCKSLVFYSDSGYKFDIISK